MTPARPSSSRSENNYNNEERPGEITATERRFCSVNAGVKWVSCGGGADHASDCPGNELDTIICLAERQQDSKDAAGAEQPHRRMLQGVHEREALRRHMHLTG